MPIFTRPRESYEYTLRAEIDLPEDERTTFLLTDLRERDRVRIMDSFKIEVSDSSDSGAVGGSGTRIYMAIKAGLVGWRGARYEDGTDVPFKTESGSKRVSDETLELLSWADKMELAEQILSSAYPSEDDTGK